MWGATNVPNIFILLVWLSEYEPNNANFHPRESVLFQARCTANAPASDEGAKGGVQSIDLFVVQTAAEKPGTHTFVFHWRGWCHGFKRNSRPRPWPYRIKVRNERKTEEETLTMFRIRREGPTRSKLLMRTLQEECLSFSAETAERRP